VTTTLHRLAEALHGERRGDDVELRDATHDSRAARPGMLFCAVPGERADGHDHAPSAVEAGAAALLVERWLDLDVPQLRVPDVRAAMGPAAALVHDRPSEDLTLVGITGTNGKTTTAYLVEAGLAASGTGVGVIGTVESRVHGEAVPGVRTTPEGPDLQRLLREMHTRGADAVAMEVSSHGLELHRVDGTRFTVAVFTNLTQDHLDFHGTMEDYFTAKARLFTPALAARGVVCVDDEWGRRLASGTDLEVETYGEHPDADHRITEVVSGTGGSRATVIGPDGPYELSTRLVGDFNVQNALAAVLACVGAGVDRDTALTGVGACAGAPGRLERVDGPEEAPVVLVDYAHTPDAIARVVAVARAVVGEGGRVHVVLGAGGDRDTGKRPQMGAAAAAADRAVLTSIVIVAGKGHETGQELADRTIPFDDRVVVADVLAGRTTIGGAA
jgi:UDP-N-acetylmuramoyl-L-alanyl-D-glutamate--2,6-diaminopimelate ligase